MGWASEELNAISSRFVEFSASCEAPVLDIGAAYGVASLAALRAGATVIANDLDEEHLRIIESRTGPHDRARLRLKPGKFPRGVAFDPESLGAVLASNVLHFLTGKQLETGIRMIAAWLRPGGKLFVHASTPYQAPFAAFLPEYERRLRAGEKWPGWIEKVSAYSSHRKLSVMPASVHLLDDVVLRRVMEAAGLEVEEAMLYRRADLGHGLALDGRECVGVIARRPAA